MPHGLPDCVLALSEAAVARAERATCVEAPELSDREEIRRTLVAAGVRDRASSLSRWPRRGSSAASWRRSPGAWTRSIGPRPGIGSPEWSPRRASSWSCGPPPLVSFRWCRPSASTPTWARRRTVRSTPSWLRLRDLLLEVDEGLPHRTILGRSSMPRKGLNCGGKVRREAEERRWG